MRTSRLRLALTRQVFHFCDIAIGRADVRSWGATVSIGVTLRADGARYAASNRDAIASRWLFRLARNSERVAVKSKEVAAKEAPSSEVGQRLKWLN